MVQSSGQLGGCDIFGISPLKMCPNRVWRTYQGGKLLEEWKGLPDPKDGWMPEEWIASLVTARNPGREYVENEGLSQTETVQNGRILLRDLIETAPEVYLGDDHVHRFGCNPGILVKVLDSQERLTVQVHPDKETAARLFNSRFGKTEAWYILGGRRINGEPPYILLGFKPGINRGKWERLFKEQDIEGMLASLNRYEVKPGQTFLIKGGVPHAIGPGCFLIEIQEPTDYTIRVERKTLSGLELPESLCHQGIGFERMFECFRYEGTACDMATGRKCRHGDASEKNPGNNEIQLIGREDTPLFGMTRLEIDNCWNIASEGSFSVLVVVRGTGVLEWENGEMSIRQGEEVFLPACLKNILCRVKATGSPFTMVRCLPPVSAR